MMKTTVLLKIGLFFALWSPCLGILHHPTATAILPRPKHSDLQVKRQNGHQSPSTAFKPSPIDPLGWRPVNTARPRKITKKRLKFPDDAKRNSETKAKSHSPPTDQIYSFLFVTPFPPLYQLPTTTTKYSDNNQKPANITSPRPNNRSTLNNARKVQQSPIPKKLAELFRRHASRSQSNHRIQSKHNASYASEISVPPSQFVPITSPTVKKSVKQGKKEQLSHRSSSENDDASQEEVQEMAESTYFPAEISLRAQGKSNIQPFSTHTFSSSSGAYLPVRGARSQTQSPGQRNGSPRFRVPEASENQHSIRDVRNHRHDPFRSIFDNSDIQNGDRGSYKIFVPGLTPVRTLFDNEPSNQIPFPKEVLARIPGYVPPKKNPQRFKATPGPRNKFRHHNKHTGVLHTIKENSYLPKNAAITSSQQSYSARNTVTPRIPGFVPPRDQSNHNRASFLNDRRPHFENQRDLDQNFYGEEPLSIFIPVDSARHFDGNFAQHNQEDSPRYFGNGNLNGRFTQDINHGFPSLQHDIPRGEHHSYLPEQIYTEPPAQYESSAINSNVPSQKYNKPQNEPPFQDKSVFLQSDIIRKASHNLNSDGQFLQPLTPGYDTPHQAPTIELPGQLYRNPSVDNRDFAARDYVPPDQPYQSIGQEYDTPKRKYQPPTREFFNNPSELYTTPNNFHADEHSALDIPSQIYNTPGRPSQGIPYDRQDNILGRPIQPYIPRDHGRVPSRNFQVNPNNSQRTSPEGFGGRPDTGRKDSPHETSCPRTKYDPDGDCIRGEAFVDYPSFERVQITSFTCDDKIPGIYADEEAGCQVWHYCLFDGRKADFICPIGTVFNQRLFTCDWWYHVDCSKTKSFYHLNEELYQGQTRSKNNLRRNTFPRPNTAYAGPSDF